MKVFSLSWTPLVGWTSPPQTTAEHPVSLVLCFADRSLLQAGSVVLSDLASLFPSALLASCSTAGEIQGATVGEGGAVALALSFHSSTVRGASIFVSDPEASEEAGGDLAAALASPDLRHVLVLSDGLFINGSRLCVGLQQALPPGVTASGGLAGDGVHFKETCTGLGLEARPRNVVGIGFYGAAFRVRSSTGGGWQPFGPKRLITKSKANVLFELDKQPALALYKRYLGERAAGLPATGLLFPLQLLPGHERESPLVRTILAVDEATQSLTFAGDLPEGYFTRLMRAGHDDLVEGAGLACAQNDFDSWVSSSAAILVSCVGRRLVLGQKIEEEVEAVLDCLGQSVVAAGFYSYGELSSSGRLKDCELHNQTMTVTLIGEVSPP